MVERDSRQNLLTDISQARVVYDWASLENKADAAGQLIDACTLALAAGVNPVDILIAHLEGMKESLLQNYSLQSDDLQQAFASLQLLQNNLTATRKNTTFE